MTEPTPTHTLRYCALCGAMLDVSLVCLNIDCESRKNRMKSTCAECGARFDMLTAGKIRMGLSFCSLKCADQAYPQGGTGTPECGE